MRLMKRQLGEVEERSHHAVGASCVKIASQGTGLILERSVGKLFRGG